MSFWFYKRDKDGKRYVYSVSVPPLLLILLLGLVVGLFAPRYIGDSNQFLRDSTALLILGFTLFLMAKISLFIKGIWYSWGPKRMNKTFRWIYLGGYIFMATGILGISPFIINQ